jgi:site-specific recombinase XerD
MAMNGATLLEIGAVLGHRSPASTHRYSHLSTDHKSKVLNDIMNKVLGES